MFKIFIMKWDICRPLTLEPIALFFNDIVPCATELIDPKPLAVIISPNVILPVKLLSIKDDHCTDHTYLAWLSSCCHDDITQH